MDDRGLASRGRGGLAAGEGEHGGAVGQFKGLGQDAFRRAQGVVEIPFRTAAARARKGHDATAEAFGDITRRIDPDHEEGQAARAGALQRGQAVAYLFEGHFEAALQPFDVKAGVLGVFEEGGVGHVQGAGEIIAQADPVEFSRFRHLQARLIAERVEGRAQFERGQDDGHVKAARTRCQGFRQQEAPAMEVEPAAGAGHDLLVQHADGETVLLL